MIEALDWRNPTPAMLAGLRLARQCTERAKLSETRYVEWLMMANESLWYFQAKQWAQEPPDLLHDDVTRDAFKRACETVVRIVDLGYDEATGLWWPLQRIWPNDADAQMGILALMDLGVMLERMKEITIWPKDVPRAYAQPGFLTVSAGFWVFISTVCGPRWRQRYEAMLRAAHEAKRLRIGPERRQGR